MFPAGLASYKTPAINAALPSGGRVENDSAVDARARRFQFRWASFCPLSFSLEGR
jgi:hypothetical protein